MAEGPKRLPRTDLFEVAAIAVLGPAAWLLPEEQAWWPVSLLLSFAIARFWPETTRLREQMLASALGPRVATYDLGRLRVDVMATYMEERLEILRAYRPGGWRPRLALEGREHLDAALAAGRGAVLWTSPFSYADLVTKMALHDAGYAVSHLSAFSRGFSPNSCWSWTRSRFGMKVLSPLRTRIEDRYLRERVVIPLDGGLRWMRTLTDRLRRRRGVDPRRRRRRAHPRAAVPREHAAARDRPREPRPRDRRRSCRSAASGAGRATS
jgi:hypothetical protein